MGGGIPGVKQASIDQLEPAVLREGVCFRREPIDCYEPGGNPGSWSQARRNMLATPDCRITSGCYSDELASAELAVLGPLGNLGDANTDARHDDGSTAEERLDC